MKAKQSRNFVLDGKLPLVILAAWKGSYSGTSRGILFRQITVKTFSARLIINSRSFPRFCITLGFSLGFKILFCRSKLQDAKLVSKLRKSGVIFIFHLWAALNKLDFDHNKEAVPVITQLEITVTTLHHT